QPGTQGGHAVAQVLFGDYNPSGKLPMTFPRSVGQVPIYYNQYSTGRPDPTANVFWSHYTDEANEPLWPFGYGLSYTEFQYGDLNVSVKNQSQVEVSVNVKNTGERAGEEVVQLYLHDRVAKVVRPIKELKGFQKINLAAGETQRVSFTLTEAELGYYDGAGTFHIDPGTFDLWVGPNSTEGLETTFELGEAQ
ncbi:MAG TPA: glycosyl hydrolase, partial [Cytophagales bacterium]|nr:glycosyl hydrolase [Cytophagales bacterium]